MGNENKVWDVRSLRLHMNSYKLQKKTVSLNHNYPCTL